MKDININNIYRMTDTSILKIFGDFIRYHRLEQNKSQFQLAKEAGIHRTTLSDFELGRSSKLITLIQLLRVLDKLYILSEFEIKRRISPIKLAELEAKQRNRASKENNSNNH